ncbi:hypothetical protein LJR231_003510 [Phyllobacterium sp. LjRoot231]|uniref:hypothetical protein n=1 Tax=Phyllobacterium sp. LjRoot231 TaxID=3342289 RepID=UPI003ECED08B
MNAAWQTARRLPKGSVPAPAPAQSEKVYPVGSLGEAFARYRTTDEWKTTKKARTREDWWRGWKYIDPVFGEFPPSWADMETLSSWRKNIEEQKSLREAHRAMKIWRALWKVAAALKYCKRDDDPSLAVTNSEPKGRSQTWTEGEAIRLVKRALRMRYNGLAAALACMWDGSVSPVDARSLMLSQRFKDGKGTWFELERGKTGRDAVLTLSRRTNRLLEWYIKATFGDADPIGSMKIFRTRRGAAYTKNSFAEDFRDIRKVEFPGDTRMMMDFRRSGAVEAVAGAASPAQLSAKMANSIGQSKKLEQTYAPVRVAAVREADVARQAGRKTLRENK